MLWESDKWEMYADKRGEHRWRRRATNGKIVGSSCEGYTNKDRWEVYKDKRNEFRWRRKATNGEVTGASSESYKAKKDAEANAQRNGM